MSKKDGATIRSDWSQVVVFKIWAPLLTGYLLRFQFDDARTVLGHVLITAPLAFAFLFFASLAVVRVNHDEIQYRRLLKWRSVMPSEVVCARHVFSSIGFLSLNRPVAPWGRIFFVLDGGQKRHLLSSPRYHLLEHLAMQLDAREKPVHHEVRSVAPWHHVELVILYLSGMLIATLYPSVGRQSSITESTDGFGRTPAANGYWSESGLASAEAMSIYCIVAAGMVLLRYRSKSRWAFAAISGLCTPALMLTLRRGLEFVLSLVDPFGTKFIG